MIQDFVLWSGSQSRTYDHEVIGWYNSIDSMDKTTIDAYDLPMYTTKGKNNKTIWHADIDNTLMDDSGSLFGERVILVRHCETLVKESSSPALTALRNYLESIEMPIHLGMVFQLTDGFGGDKEPPANLRKAADNYYNRTIPTDPRKMGKWISEFLKENQILLDPKEGRKIAEYVGFDTSKLVEGLYEVIGRKPQRRMTADELIPMMGNLGFTVIWDLFNAFVSGNRAKTAEQYLRLCTLQEDLKILWQVKKRMRGYVALLDDPDYDITLFGLGGSPAMKSYMVKEANRIGRDGVLQMLNAVSEADYALKGGSTLSENSSMLIMFDKLACIASGQKV